MGQADAAAAAGAHTGPADAARRMQAAGAQGDSDELVRRSVDMILAQSRAGSATSLVMGALFGLLYVPAAGWLAYLAWYLPFGALMAGRQGYFRRLVARQGATPRSLRRIALVAAFTGWLAPASVPLFASELMLSDIGVLTIITVGWASVAVAVLAVQPRIYAGYLAACFATIYLAWMPYADDNDLLMIGVSMVLGGAMMVKLANVLWAQLRDAVGTSVDNATLVARLRDALERQEDARRARSRFLGAASHDLRQPVQALLFLSDIFRKSTDAARRDAMALQIARTGESIDGMFRHLVDFAQIDAGTMKAVVQPVQLDRLVQAAISGYAEKCAARGLRFHLDVESPLSVQADPVLLERMLRNFLDNAWKYSLRGQVTLRVARSGDTVLVSVADQGVGMTEDERAQAFNAFYRGPSASQAEAEGIGLGLAICRHMADLMAVPLELESRAGAGTRVTMRLQLADRAAAGRAARPAGGGAPLAGRLVAVLENDRLAREALCTWLQEAGAQVACGASLAQLRDDLGRLGGAPDVIVADYRLAEGTGVEAVDALRAEYGPVPALVVSGETDILERALGVPVLQKPVQPARLLECLRREMGAGGD